LHSKTNVDLKKRASKVLAQNGMQTFLSQ